MGSYYGPLGLFRTSKSTYRVYHRYMRIPGLGAHGFNLSLAYVAVAGNEGMAEKIRTTIFSWNIRGLL